MSARPIWVGERGPELFVPLSPGNIVMNEEAVDGDDSDRDR